MNNSEIYTFLEKRVFLLTSNYAENIFSKNVYNFGYISVA